MKKYITTLLMIASAMFAPAADLENKLLGYWQVNEEETLALAKKENRKVNPLAAALEAKIILEFQRDKMIVHFPKELEMGETNSVPYTIKKVDKAANTLILATEDKPDGKAVFKGEQLALKFGEGSKIFNRLSKEAFAKLHERKAAPAEAASPVPTAAAQESPQAPKPEDVTDKPIPATPAAGKINGVDFKVEEATLKAGDLRLRQTVKGGENRFGFNKNWFDIELAKSAQPLEGKTFITKPGERSKEINEISENYVEQLGKSGSSSVVTWNATMKLEFGKAKDGKLPGKIHLRIAGQPESFVVGSFEAKLE